jgi:hypothetical protein
VKACRGGNLASVESLPGWKPCRRGKLAEKMEAVKVNPTRSWRWARKIIQMTSDGKVFYTEVVRIVETVNFAFGVIIIGDSIRPAKLL